MFNREQQSTHSRQYYAAMKRKLDSFAKNNTWILVDLPADKKTVDTK